MSGFFHLVVTRLAVRNLLDMTVPDPLAPERLERRLALLEALVLPTLLAQSCMDYRWLVLVDEALPGPWRDRLDRLVARHPNGSIAPMVGRGPDALWRAMALEVPDGTRRLLHTTLDDDDALHRDFIAWLQSEVTDPGDQDFGLRLLAVEEALQWDLVRGADAAYGYVKPWTRRDYAGRPFAVSAGFSICTAFPAVPVCIGHVHHSVACNVLREDDPETATHPRVAERVLAARSRVRAALARTPWSDEPLSLERHYRVCTLAGTQGVMTNHGDNAQVARLEQRADLRTAVDPETTFDGVAVDWDRMRRLMA